MALIALGVPPVHQASAATVAEVADVLQPGTRPAVGLGGDPFLSPLDDRVGWWSEPRLARGPSFRLDDLSSDPVSPGWARGLGEWSNRSRSSGLTAAGRLAGRDWLVAGRWSHPEWRGSWRSGSGGVRLDGSAPRAEAALRVEGLVPGLTAQIGGPLWSSRGIASGSTFGAGLRYRAGPRLEVQGAWTGSRVPDRIESDLYEIPISASLNFGAERRQLDARLGLARGLAAEGSFGRATHREMEGRSGEPGYQLLPRGECRQDQLSLRWGGAHGRGVLARWTDLGLDARGDACWGGQRFGQLDYAEARMRSWLLAAEAGEGTRWVLDAEAVEARIRARAEIESWPFTPTVVDLLGLRRIFALEGRARWHRFHAGLDRGLVGRLRAQLGLSAYDIRPSGSLDSWRPLFLVFGRADARRDELGIGRVLLGAVSLGCRASVGGTEAALGIRQFVFARTWRVAESPGPGAPAASPPPPSAGGRGHGWPGGTQVQLSITRGL